MSKNGSDQHALPNVEQAHLDIPAADKLAVDAPATHRPRILLLYGSLRARSYSRFLAFEAARLLETFGAETSVFDPAGLPLPDGAPETHPKCRSCAGSRHGRKVRSGARPSVTGR